MMKKMSFALGCICLLILAGCEKENNQEAVVNIPKAVCDPVQDVIGYTAACNEIAAIVNCNYNIDCAYGNTLSSYFTSYVYDCCPTVTPYAIASTDTVTMALQAEIAGVINSYATTYCPAGYFVDQVWLSPIPIPNTNLANLYVYIQYKKCLFDGGPGGGNG